MKHLLLYFILGISLLLISCEGDEVVDISAPTIELTEPVNGEAVAAGTSMFFEAIFEDDEALSTYNIDLHGNFDAHSHGRLAATEFDFEQSFTISGSRAEVSEEIAIPATALAGPYDLSVEAIDAAGNSTSFVDGSSKLVQVWITNEEMAVVHFENAEGQEVEEYDVSGGVPVAIYGLVEDLSGSLDFVEVIVGHLDGEADHSHEGGRILEEVYFEADFEVEGMSSVRLEDLLTDSEIMVAPGEEELFLIVIVEDEEGNISRHYIELHFQ